MSLLSALVEDDLLGRPVPMAGAQGASIAKREFFFNVRRDALRGDGTPKSPFNGSDPDIMDRLLNGGDNSGIDVSDDYLWPGHFQDKRN
jgi:hypothetical protein